MQNFFTPPDFFGDTEITLTGDEYHHATRACRVRLDEVIGITDGRGRRASARITFIDSSELRAEIIDDLGGQGEPDMPITVALSVIKPARFEAAVEKCTELGVRTILPVVANRCETAPERLNEARMRRIALEAAKQSGRSWIPEIKEPLPLMNLYEQVSDGVILASADAENDMGDALKKAGTCDGVTLVIGPEGDFTEEEHDVLITGGAIPVNLGGLLLRAETAAIAATVQLLSCGGKNRKKTLFG